MADGSNKFKNSINLNPQSSDPSNPAEGDVFRSDGTSRTKGIWEYKDGAWVEVGSGSGSGGINYLEGDNNSFESSVGDWVAYADAAGTEPVDGTGGSPTITIVKSVDTSLRGDSNGLITKDAANRQGEGASCAFTIDEADKAKKLTISFDYTTSANYADDDIKIFVYDVTNTTLIRVNGEDLKAISGQSTHYAQFQTAPDSTSYRLIIHQSTTDATAYTVRIDNVKVGPTALAKGAIVTDWEDFTPVIKGVTSDPSFGATSVFKGEYRRVGDSAEIRIEVQQTSAGTAGSGNYYFQLPNGLVADQNKIQGSATTGLGTVGALSARVAAVSYVGAAAAIFDNGSGIGLFATSTSSTGYISSTLASLTASEWRLSLEATVPIVGWSSEAVLSEDLGGREHITEISQSLTQTLTDAAGFAKVAFNGSATKNQNTVAAWDETNFRINILETGNYDIYGRGDFGAGVDDDANIGVTFYVNGVSNSNFGRTLIGGTSGNTNSLESSRPAIKLNKGDYVEMYVYWNDTVGSASCTLTAANFLIAKRSSPQTILETETVAARYTSNAGQAIPSSLGTTFKAETIDYDTHNAYDTLTGEYTIPVSGKYDIKIRLHADPSDSLSANAFFQIALYVNGSNKEELGFIKNDSSGTLNEFSANGSAQIDLEKGDIVSITFRENSTDTTNLSASNNQNVFSIARIK